MGALMATEDLGTRTSTGTFTQFVAGNQDRPGASSGIFDPTVILFISGITSATLKVECSPDGTIWQDYITNITADRVLTIKRPPRFLRVNCTAYTSGTIRVFAQKFLEDN